MIFFAWGMLISYPLWNNSRSFPSFPIFDFSENILRFDYYIPVLILGAGFIAFLFPSRKTLQTTLSFLLLSILLDQNRIQPWVYFYIIFFIGLVISEDTKETNKFLRLVLVGVYFWSGIHKMNPIFREVIFESILIDGLKIESVETVSSAKQFYLLVPFLEILTAVFLAFQRTKKVGVYLGLLGHLFILYYLVFGLQGNWVIIPWNIFLMIVLVFLFYQNKSKFEFPKSNFSKIILGLCFLILPVGYFVGITDHSLSFGLYDGKLKNIYLLKTDKTGNHHKYSNFEIHSNLLEKGSLFDLNKWAFEEMEVPFYFEERYLKQLIGKEKNVLFLITETPLWERNLLGTFKTSEEKLELIKLKQIERLTFKDSVYLGNYTLIYK